MTYETPIGANMFAYCGNNPVMNIDPTGDVFGTIFDIVSLGYSIYQAAKNPDDPMAKLAVAADAASLLIPMVSGGGAAVRAASKMDDAIDAVQSLGTAKIKASITNDIIDLPRVGSALKKDINHAFPDVVDNYAGYATKFKINNGTLYQLGGSYRGIDGRFEWIVEDNSVTHRFFVKGGGINGIPIKP